LRSLGGFEFRDLLLRSSKDLVRSKTEFHQQIFERRRAAKRVHANLGARLPHMSIPADHRPHFHRHAGTNLRRKDVLAVRLVLLLEELPRRHADDARGNPFLFELLKGVKAKRDFAACADQNNLRFLRAGIGKNIRAAGDAGCGRIVLAIECRQRLACKYQASRLVFERDDDLRRTASEQDLVRVDQCGGVDQMLEQGEIDFMVLSWR